MRKVLCTLIMLVVVNAGWMAYPARGAAPAAPVAATAPDAQAVLNPPPLKLEFKDATLTDIAAALSKELGVPLKVWPPGEDFRRGMRFTLSAKERTLWEVLSEMSVQHGVLLQYFGSDLQLQQQDPGIRKFVVSGPLAVFPGTITRSRTVDLQTGDMRAENWSLGCAFLIDPRVKLASRSQLSFTEIVDDVGNVLLKGPPDTHLWPTEHTRGGQSMSVGLTIPEKRGSKIASAKGQIRVVVPMEEAKVVVEDAQKKVGETIDVGGKKLTLTRLEQEGDQLALVIQTPRSGGIGRLLGGKEDQSTILLRVTDAANQEFYRHDMSVNNGENVRIGGQFKGPFKLQLSAVTKSQDLTLPFELKDLPLP